MATRNWIAKLFGQSARNANQARRFKLEISPLEDRAVPAAVGFNPLTYTVNENGGNATVTVVRTGDASAASTVAIAATGGTATAGTDYGTVPTPVTFAAGQTTATVNIPIINDNFADPSETVVLTLSAPTGGDTLDPTGTAATVTINDDEVASPTGGTIGFDSPTYTVAENAVNAILTLTRSGTSTAPASVTLTATGSTATAGSDFGTVPTTVNFAAGQTTATVQIPITNDTSPESAETVTFALSAPTGGAQLSSTNSNATLTITDDDSSSTGAGTIGFSTPSYTVTEGTANATLTLTRTGGSTGPVTVTLTPTGGTATAGTDFGTVPTTVSFADGQTSATVQIPITDDALAEGPESIIFTLSAPSGGAQLDPALSAAVLTIIDNEGTGGGVSPVAVSTNLAVGGSLNGQALVYLPDSGAPAYNASASATISAFGSISANVRTAVGDVNGDGTEDIILVTGPGTPIRFAVVSGIDNTTLLIPSTAPFAGSESFTGGGFVSSADFDNDGRDEVVVTPDQGGGPRVTIFSLVGTTPTVKANFLGIDDSNFRGGARSAAGDVNHDGIPDLAIAAGFQGGPRIALFNGATVFVTPIRLTGDFFAFEPTLRNGAYVAIGDVDGDGFGDLTFGAGPGGAPRVLTISGSALLTTGGSAATLTPLANFFVAGNSTDRGGVRVATKNADGDNKAEVVIGSGEGQPARVRVYSGATFVGSGEPAFQDLNLFGGTALTDGVFVG